MSVNISANVVKELRDITGAGMMDCKRALAECEGDMEAAKDWLRKRGQAIADKKSSRAASEGLIFIHVENGVAALLELNCETDFVARNEAFPEIGRALVAKLAAEPASAGSTEAFLASASPIGGGTVADLIKEKIAVLGENLGVGAVRRVEAASSSSRFQTYIHPPGKLGVLLEVSTGKPETADKPEFQELMRDVAMHVAAASPVSVDSSSVPADVIEREKAIYRDQAIQEGKGEKFLDKIIEGRISKFFKQVCLLEQEFVKNPDVTIAKLLELNGKQLGDTLQVVGFVRMKIGA